MTNDELLYKIENDHEYWTSMRRVVWRPIPEFIALVAIVKLHIPKLPTNGKGLLRRRCTECGFAYPCPTIQAIKKELK